MRALGSTVPRTRARSARRRLNAAVAAPGPWLRAALVAVAAVALGAFGHAVVAGGAVDPLCLGLSFIPVLVLARVQASRELGLLTLTGLMLLAQVIVHVSASPSTAHHSTNAWAMLAVHVLSAVVVAAAISRTEALVWARARLQWLAGWLLRAVARSTAAAPSPQWAPVRRITALLPVHTPDVLTRVPARRGPPLACCSSFAHRYLSFVAPAA